jgi:hypothetical protein
MAWGNTGHEAIACMAWKNLQEPTKDKIFALLQQVPTRKSADGTRSIAGFAEWSQGLPAGLSEDQQHMYIFMRAATWADSIKHTFLQDSDTPPADFAAASSNLGFTDAFSHGYWHFIDTAFGAPLKGKTKPPALPASCAKFATPAPVKVLPAAPIPNAATEIVLLSAALASDESTDLKAYDLLWLEHIVGDVHQPLHASVHFVDGLPDSGGNCVAIAWPKDLSATFNSANPGSTLPSELHAVWDDLPGVGTQMDTQKAADYAATLTPVADAQIGSKVPADWAAESLAMAEKDAYSGPIGNGFGTPKAYLLTYAYFATANADARARIALAGARLANLLTTALH